MRSPYLYILIKWNTIKKHGGVLDAEYLWERNRKKMEYNKPNPKRKTRNRKKKLIFCRGREMAKMLPRQRGYSSRFVLRTGTNGPGQGPARPCHVDDPFIPVRNTTGTNGGEHLSRLPHPGWATGTNGPKKPGREGDLC